MINLETLFILGAGSSVPYGFPTGKGLRKYISNEFPKLFETLLETRTKLHPRKIRRLTEEAHLFADTFYKSNIPSIDQFLAIRGDKFGNIGKIAIAFAMLEYEKNSVFRNESEAKFPEQDWYSLIFKKMSEGLYHPESYVPFLGNKVSFITFNYDRSLEHFLYDSFIHTYFGDDTAIRLFNNSKPFNFIHIYGQIDKPVWNGGRDYREDYDYEVIEKLKDNIKLIGERPITQSPDISLSIKWAKRIFILGFGFAKENLEVLGINDLDASQKIYGTAMGFTENQRKDIIFYFKNRFKGDTPNKTIQITDHNCYQLLYEQL